MEQLLNARSVGAFKATHSEMAGEFPKKHVLSKPRTVRAYLNAHVVIGDSDTMKALRYNEVLL